MNIYLITCPEPYYDEYQAWVVIAASAEDALELLRSPHLTHERTNTELLGTSNETTPRVAHTSFIAG